MTLCSGTVAEPHEPTEMEGPCEHILSCPLCGYGFAIKPCGHEFTDAPLVYRTAVNGPMEVR